MIGVDGQLSSALSAQAHGPRVSQDAVGVHDAFTLPPRRRLRSMIVAGAVVLGVAGGITLALRRPGVSSEPPRVATPAPAPAPAVAPAEVQGSPAEAAAPAVDDDAADAVAAKAAEGKPVKAKASKSRHRSARRKDPVKW